MKQGKGAAMRSSSRFSSRDKRILAIASAVLAMLSPLYIDRNSKPESEVDEEEPIYLLPVLQMVLLIAAIAVSAYLQQGFTRLDPYWIHRVSGSSTGIVIVLIVLTLVLKCKATKLNGVCVHHAYMMCVYPYIANMPPFYNVMGAKSKIWPRVAQARRLSAVPRKISVDNKAAKHS
ncbi:hypothetical protein OROGR_005993 [Orobanche gracilis]